MGNPQRKPCNLFYFKRGNEQVFQSVTTAFIGQFLANVYTLVFN